MWNASFLGKTQLLLDLMHASLSKINQSTHKTSHPDTIKMEQSRGLHPPTKKHKVDINTTSSVGRIQGEASPQNQNLRHLPRVANSQNFRELLRTITVSKWQI